MTKPRRVSRRRFLTLAGGGAGALLGARSQSMATWAQGAVARANDPDLIVVNAKVYTVDDRLPKAEAFAIKGGRFLAVGSSADVRNLARRDTPIFDAQQMTIVPGFIDCHNHAEGEVLLYEVLVGDPFEVKFVTIDSIIEKLRKKAGETPPGTWVEGYFFDDTKVSDKRQLNVHDLDKVSAEHPVVVHHRGGHTGFYNSKALQLAGITKDTPNPPGGTFDRDKNGELNGRVSDRAMEVFAKVGVRPVYTPAVKAQADETPWRISRGNSFDMASPACITTTRRTCSRYNRSGQTAISSTASRSKQAERFSRRWWRGNWVPASVMNGCASVPHRSTTSTAHSPNGRWH